MKIVTNKEGFTLIEVIVAISILALVSVPVASTLVKAYGKIHKTGQESQQLFHHQRELEKLYAEHEVLGKTEINVVFANGTNASVYGDIVGIGGLESFILGEETIDIGDVDGNIDIERVWSQAVGGNHTARRSRGWHFKIRVYDNEGKKVKGLTLNDFQFFILKSDGTEDYISMNQVTINQDKVTLPIPNQGIVNIGVRIYGQKMNHILTLK